MLISPPFLPRQNASETDESYLDRAMQEGTLGEGAFPLSSDMNWHGGVHLTAPLEDGQPLPVRAIADGVLTYIRLPLERGQEGEDSEHALNYNGWSDNGCIVLRHETETGEYYDSQAELTSSNSLENNRKAKIIFYSIYMHLSETNLTQADKGKKVYRKDSIGKAGSIYSKPNKIHFEIIANDEEILNIIGRNRFELDYLSSNGRTDSCWGDMHFFIPPEVSIYETPPRDLKSSENNSPVMYKCPIILPHSAAIQDGPSLSQPIHNSVTPLVDEYDIDTAISLQKGIFVRMQYEKGQCTLTTYHESGSIIGVSNEEQDYEYKLYETALKIYTQSPSAGYEILRFGRIIGPDHLVPDEAAHWRKIAIPTATAGEGKFGWVNLNSPTVGKFSDADFPHWLGWRLVSDDDELNGHCQSENIKTIISKNALLIDNSFINSDIVELVTSQSYEALNQEEKDNLSERYKAESEINIINIKTAETTQELKRLICKFPSEWWKDNFDARFSWLKRVSPQGPLSQEDYLRFKKHYEALAFLADTENIGIESIHWHFPPKEFIKAFRKCSWLSLDEISSTVPKYFFYEQKQDTYCAHTSGSPQTYQISKSTARSRLSRYYIDINKTFRKYMIETASRRTHFLAQTFLETDRWRTLSEYGRGQTNPNIPKAQYYSAFYGRGIMQLTWALNYETYGKFRSTNSLRNSERSVYTDQRISILSEHYWEDPIKTIRGAPKLVGTKKRWSPRFDPNLIADVPYHACDSGGFYWASKSWKNSNTGIREKNINAVCDQVFNETNVGRVCVLVNGGGNGYHERQAYSKFIYRYLSDSTETEELVTYTTPRHKIAVNYSRNL